MVRTLPILTALLLTLTGDLRPSAALELVCAGLQQPSSPVGIAGKATAVRTFQDRSLHGGVHALVVFAKFGGERPGLTTAPHTDRIFQPDLPGSLTHFYTTMSSGQFHLAGTVLPRRYESRQAATTYLAVAGEEYGQYGRFAREILTSVDDDVDFGQFDNDGPDGVPNSGDDDGYVDHIFINVLSTPTDFIRGGATGVAGFDPEPTTTFRSQDPATDGGRIMISSSPAAGSLSREGSYAQTVSTMAHELGHAFGLPDLFDLDYSGPEDDSAGIGRWGLMGMGAQGWDGSDGPNPFCAWSLEQLGWIGSGNDHLVEVEEDAAGLVLADRFRGGMVYRVPLQTPLQTGHHDRGEYLLFERRTRSATYYDRNMPAEGVLVWHVRSPTGNVDEFNKKVDLVCADGRFADAGFPLGTRADARYGLDNLDFWAHDETYAADHGGNTGDATDPFDGVRYRELDLRTNPSTDPGGFAPDAFTGLSVTISREGQGMWLDVVEPRWSGLIDQSVRWEGRVLVTGDIRVDAGDTLSVEADSRVLFAPGDVTGGGDDPERSELRIEGSFTARKPVTFAALDPRFTWRGITLVPSPESWIGLPATGIDLRDAEIGLWMPAAPPEFRDRVEVGLQIVDSGPGTAGNGNGRLSPGEVFRVKAEVTNWTDGTRYNVATELNWSGSDILTRNEGPRSMVFEELHLSPGVVNTVLSDPLRLSPTASAGARVSFSFRQVERICPVRPCAWGKELRDTVEGAYLEHTARLSAEAVERRGDAYRVPAGQPIPVRALISGDVDRAQLVLYATHSTSLNPLEVVPLQPEATGSLSVDQRAFTAELTLPAPGLFEAFLSVGDDSGATVFSDTKLLIWAHGSGEQLPVLAFVQGGLTRPDSAAIAAVLEDVMSRAGHTFQIITPIPDRAEAYDLMLPFYHDGGHVLWLQGHVPNAAGATLRTLVDRGGNLLMMTDYFGSAILSIFNIVGTERTYAKAVRPITDVGVDLLNINLNGVRALQLRSPARPLFLLGADRVTGAYVGDDGHRAVLMPFGIEDVEASLRSGILQAGLEMLSGEWVNARVAIKGQGPKDLVALPVADPVPVTVTMNDLSAAQGIDSIVERAHLTLFTHGDPQPLDIVPLEPVVTGGQPDEHSFTGVVTVPAPGLHEARLSLNDDTGASIFSDARLRIWANDYGKQRPVLAIMEGGERSLGGGFVGDMEELLARLGRSLQVITPFPAEAETYSTLLSFYRDRGDVLWLEGTIPVAARQQLAAHLEGGGNLLAMTKVIFDRSDDIDVVRDMLHVEAVDGTRVSKSLRPIGLTDVDRPFSFGHLIQVLKLRSPARPLFILGADEMTGAYVDNGTYRSALIPFSMQVVPNATRMPLLEGILSLFSGQSVETRVEIQGRDHGGLLAVSEDEPARVTLRTDGAAARADLRAYPLVEGELPEIIPMHRDAESSEDETVFEASLSLSDGERYMLAPVIYDDAGNRLFSAAQIGLIGYRPDADALILFGPRREQDRLELQSSVDRVMDQFGWQASFMQERDLGEYVGPLFQRYGEVGKTIVSFSSLDGDQERGIRQLLSGPSRLLLVSTGSSQRTDSFSREVLRLSSRLGARTRDVSSTGLLAGVDGEIFHTPLLLLPPAIPLVVNEDGFAAGGYVREGQTQLLFLAFSADRLPAERRERLIADALRVLERDEEVELDFPGALKVGNCVVVEPGERITVTATSRQKVTELVMWSGTDMRPFRVSAMSDVGGSYSGSFVAPAAGGFAVAARVVGEAGTPALVGPSIQVLPVSLREKADVLAFLPDDVRFVSDNLRETISRLGLEADLVPNRVTDMEMLGFLLNRAAAEGDAVVWASDDVWEGEMAALSAFVENGGRLMLFSDELPDTEWGAAFLGAAVGITEIGVGFRYRSFPVGPAQDGVTVRLQSRAFSIDASAQALLRDSQEKISGVHKATDTFRVVFLPLSLRSLGTREVDTPFLAGLFQRGLQLLTQEFDGPVGISSIRAPAAVTRIGPLRPEIVVTNETDLPSTAFRVGFRVSVSDSVVANFEHIEEPLDAGAERTITLGEWPSLNEREVEIRVGVGWLDGDLAYLPPQNVHVLDLQDRFGQVHLPTATGAGFFDFDGDADDDLYLVRQDQENVLFRNDGAGVFADAGADAGLAHAGRGRGIAVSDFDGDGDLDVYLVNEESNRLYGNTGAGQFVDWTAASSAHPDPERSLADASSGRSAGFFDGDRDGDLDLYVVNAAAANRFFENTNGLFTERAAEVGLDDAGDGRGLTFGDYDGDADVDLFVANLDGNALLRNDGGRYTEVHAAAGITAVPDGIGGVFGDYDNDGDLDLFVACLASDNRLYRNRGDGNYEIATGQDLDLGAASVSSAFGDFDNDGDLDLAVTTLSSARGGDEIYDNRGHGVLLPVGSPLALNTAASGRALSLADVDGDGDQDLFVAHLAGHSALYVNSTERRNWLQVSLQDVGPNRDGLGAVVELVAGGVRQRRDVQPVFGYLSHGPAEAHFGLGDAASVDTLRVLWPDGAQTVRTSLELDQLNQRRIVSRERPTSIDTEGDLTIPIAFQLGVGFPNPFNARVAIPLDVPRQSTVQLDVFNIAGQRVRTLVNDVLTAGTHRIIWDGRSADGLLLGSGVYILHMRAGEFRQAQRVLLLK